jgi:hypothetical protein
VKFWIEVKRIFVFLTETLIVTSALYFVTYFLVYYDIELRNRQLLVALVASWIVTISLITVFVRRTRFWNVRGRRILTSSCMCSVFFAFLAVQSVNLNLHFYDRLYFMLHYDELVSALGSYSGDVQPKFSKVTIWKSGFALTRGKVKIIFDSADRVITGEEATPGCRRTVDPVGAHFYFVYVGC